VNASEDDPFLLLGVEPGSSSDVVESAYRRLAQIYHPDRYQSAPEEVRLEAGRRMVQLNGARDAIKAGYERPEPIPSSALEEALRRAQYAANSYSGPHCAICGSAPVAQVKFKACIGKLVWRQVRSWEGPLCRGCGEALYREMQNETMVKGWWGVISFLANVFAILSNWSQHQRVKALGLPMATPKSFSTPANCPLSPGLPMWQRLGPWMSVVVILVAGFIIAGSASSSSSGNFATSPCGRMVNGSQLERLSCSDPSVTVEVLAGLGPYATSNAGCPPITLFSTEGQNKDGHYFECWGNGDGSRWR
jgi:hypothetical protein